MCAYLAEVVAPHGLESTNRQWTTDEIEERHKELLTRHTELQFFCHKRGLTEDSVKRFKIGLFRRGNDRYHPTYTIPVFSDIGALMAVRYYRPIHPAQAAEYKHKLADYEAAKARGESVTKPDEPKNKWGVKGVTTKHLYPWLGMNGANQLWICEGEFDAMMAIQNGIQAITTTAGAPTTPVVMHEHRNVFGYLRHFVLAFDADDEGRFATAHMWRVFRGRVDGMVWWPDSWWGHHDHKDVSDWFNGGGNADGLRGLVRSFDAPAWDSWADKVLNEEVEKKGLSAQRVVVKDEAAAMPLLAGASATVEATATVAASPLAQSEPGELADAIDAALPCEQGPPPDSFDAASMVPKSGFFIDYLDYASKQTDAPDQFHIATALSILGIVISRRVGCQFFGEDRLFPNFFTAILAPSSIYRKTTSLKIGLATLWRCNPAVTMPNAFSTEAFILRLAKVSSSGLLYYREFSELIDQFKKGYSEGLLALLTDFYDSPGEYERATQKDGTLKIKDLFISIIGTSTLDWINENLSHEQSQKGFWPRFLFVTARHRKKFMAEPHKPTQEERALMAYKLKEFSTISGEMALSEEAKSLFAAWQADRDRDGLTHALGEAFIKYVARYQAYVIKVAMLYEISQTFSLTISGYSMQVAINFVNWTLDQLAYLFTHEIAFDQDDAKLQKITNLILKHPGITSKEISKRAHLMADKLERYMKTLVFRGQVRQETRVNKNHTTSVLCWPTST